MGFSRQEYWRGLPFPSPVDHVLLELSAMTCLPWVTLHGMAHSFIELDKAVVHVINLVIFLWLWFSVCLPSDGEGLGTYGSFLIGETDWEGNWVLFWWVVGALFSKSLIQFSVDGWSCVPFLLFDWRPNYCEWMKSLSRVQLFETPWTVAYQAPPSMGFSRQEYWSGLPFPSPGDLPDPGIKPGLPHSRQML